MLQEFDQKWIFLGLTNNRCFHPPHWLICSVYCKSSLQPWWKWSESSRQATFLLQRDRERRGGLMAFTGLSRLNTRKPGKCQVFLKNVRSYISLLFVPLFPPFCFHRLDACLSDIMSAPRGWVARCDPPCPSFMCAPTPSSSSFQSSPTTIDCISWIHAVLFFWSFSKSLFLSGSEFRGGWELLNSKLSGPAKGHSPDHPGWLWTEPAAVISGAQSGRKPKKDDKNRVSASDKMARLLGNRQDVKSATS